MSKNICPEVVCAFHGACLESLSVARPLSAAEKRKLLRTIIFLTGEILLRDLICLLDEHCYQELIHAQQKSSGFSPCFKMACT